MTLLVRNKDFRKFFLSNCFDFFGERCISIVLPIILYIITNNIYSTAILMLCRFLPKFFSNYIVKKINDLDFPPIFILKYVSIIRIIVFPLFLLATAQWHYYIFTIIIYFTSSISYAYRYAVIKNTCFISELSQANNMLSMLENITMLVAPLIGGWIYSYLGLKTLVFVSTVCFLLAYLFLNKIKIDIKTHNEMSEQETSVKYINKEKNFFNEVLRVTKKYPSAFILIIVDTIASISFGSLNTIMPIITQLHFDNNAKIYSYMNTALALGLVVGNLIFHRKLIKANYRLTYVFSTFFATLFFVLLGFWNKPISILILLFLIGLCNSIQDSSLVTDIQIQMKSTSDISFMFSVYQSLLALMIVISTIIVPVIISYIGTIYLFVSLGIVNILGLLLLLKKRRKS